MIADWCFWKLNKLGCWKALAFFSELVPPDRYASTVTSLEASGNVWTWFFQYFLVKCRYPLRTVLQPAVQRDLLGPWFHCLFRPNPSCTSAYVKQYLRSFEPIRTPKGIGTCSNLPLVAWQGRAPYPRSRRNPSNPQGTTRSPCRDLRGYLWFSPRPPSWTRQLWSCRSSTCWGSVDTAAGVFAAGRRVDLARPYSHGKRPIFVSCVVRTVIAKSGCVSS